MPRRVWPRSARTRSGAQFGPYGGVVDRVNVSVLLYVPVRSASLAPIVCLKLTCTDSFEVGAVQLLSSVGAALPPTGANGPPALACSACGSENVPFTRWPVATED